MAKKSEKQLENLVQNSRLSPSERQAKARKAGIASGKARRARKTLRDELIALLSSGDLQERMSLALINEALNGNNSGSVRGAFETIRDTIGEKPSDELRLEGGVRFTFSDGGDEYAG